MKAFSLLLLIFPILLGALTQGKAETVAEMIDAQASDYLLQEKGDGWQFTLYEVLLTKHLELPACSDDYKRISEYEPKHSDSVILFVRYNIEVGHALGPRKGNVYRLEQDCDSADTPNVLGCEFQWPELCIANGPSVHVFQTRMKTGLCEIALIAEVPVKQLIGSSLHVKVPGFKRGEYCPIGKSCNHADHVRPNGKSDDCWAIEPTMVLDKQYPLNIDANTQIVQYTSRNWVIGEETPEAIQEERDEVNFRLQMMNLESQINSAIHDLD